MKKTAPAPDRKGTENFERGRLLRHQGNLAQAQSLLEKASADSPQRLDIALHWAETLLRRDKIDEYFKALRGALASSRPPARADIDGWLLRYRLATALMDFAEAARIGETILDASRRLNHIEALTWPVLIDDFPNSYRPRALVVLMEKALAGYISKNEDSPWGYYFRLYLLDRMRDRHPTVIHDIARLREFPAKRYGWMRYEPAMYHLHTLNFEDAIADYRAAAACSDPPHWRALYRQAEAQFCLGNLPAARRGLADALLGAEDRQRAQLLAYASWLELMSGDDRRAWTLWKQAEGLGVRRYPRHVPGALLLRLGRLPESLKALEEVLAGEPGNEQALLWHAEALLSEDRADEALASADRAVALEKGGNFYGVMLRGLASAKRGDDESLERARQAMPPEVLRFVESKSPPRSRRAPQRTVEIFQSVLELSRGIRKDGYLRKAWMR